MSEESFIPIRNLFNWLSQSNWGSELKLDKITTYNQKKKAGHYVRKKYFWLSQNIGSHLRSVLLALVLSAWPSNMNTCNQCSAEYYITQKMCTVKFIPYCKVQSSLQCKLHCPVKCQYIKEGAGRAYFLKEYAIHFFSLSFYSKNLQ